VGFENSGSRGRDPSEGGFPAAAGVSSLLAQGYAQGQSDDDTSATTGGGTNVQFSAELFCSFSHVTKPESFATSRPGHVDPNSVIINFEDEFGRVRLEKDVEKSWIGVANRIADRFLSDAKKMLLDLVRQVISQEGGCSKTAA
jgi:hypothetical protein